MKVYVESTVANLQPVPLKVALHGMDARSQKTMALYLKGPCRGAGIVVEDADADVNLIDADFPAAGEILQTCQSRHPDRPVVLLSLQPLQINGTDFVQKPVNAERLMAVLNKFKALTSALSQPQNAVEAKEKTGDEVIKTPEQAKKRVLYEGNEGGYARFLGLLPGVEFNNLEQIVKAGFDPKLYYLNYVLSACKVTCRENRALQLRSIWKPLLIFPDTRQVWLDADDKQLRAFAGVEQAKGFAASIGLSPLDESVRGSLAPEKFQALEVFVWKLAIWTSKGRFPLFLPPEQPVYLKHWPNFTRLLLLPDALRISSLLIRDARAPLEIIDILEAKPQHVFAFISACHSLGLLEPGERRRAQSVAAQPPVAGKKHGLLSKILHRLRAV
ncbi:MAG: hypothetical protein CTY34_04655 [Methylobacter sp.]|nr:MAG: hypothetical protein CTY34_04655 [Methylobacter sp.]PPD32322.1 MAG: hypothetical protein CTY18_10930 [Methylomonas sp.]